MSVKAMIFIDGTWLYRNRQFIFDALGEDATCEIDYKRLPEIIGEEIANVIDLDVDIVRTNYFGMIPVNKPGYNPSKQITFYEFLERHCAYDMHITDFDFRDPASIRTDERWVNATLASSMMRYAMIPGAFDVAVLVGVDASYIPLLVDVRHLGKRVQLVDIKPIPGKYISATSMLSAPSIQDFPPILLDEHASDIRLTREEQKRTCQQCGKEEVTTWAGPEFFCTECRTSHRTQVRTCQQCGKETETTWDRPIFYCEECRNKHRTNTSE